MRPFRIVKNYRYFEAQEKGESVILITRKHWLVLITPFLFGAFAGGVLLYFFGIASRGGSLIIGDIGINGRLAFAYVLVLYVIMASFVSWLLRYLNVMILTNKHIVDVSQKGFFARSVSTLALNNIEDVSIDKNGFWATMFDFGDIKIQTAGELPNFELKSIADPETVQRTIMEAKESFGGHKKNL